jgi:hypothetical protein
MNQLADVVDSVHDHVDLFYDFFFRKVIFLYEKIVGAQFSEIMF